jgi:hypothetical protein
MLKICLPLFFILSSTVFAEEINLIVGYENNVTQETIISFETEYQLNRLNYINELNCGFYNYEGDIEQIISELNALPQIRYAEKNIQVFPASEPDFNKQYYLENSGQVVNNLSGVENIDISWASANNFYKNEWFQKNSVVVAVIDSGLSWSNNSEFLGNNLHVNTAELTINNGITGVDDDNNNYIDDFLGWNFIDNNAFITDANGHGTQVASIIAATADGQGMQGIAQNVKILPLKVFGSPSQITQTSNIVSAVIYAINNGANIINLSLKCSYSGSLQDAINLAEQNSILVICAAGNGGSDFIGDNNDNSPVYPASFTNSNVVSVASINQLGNLSYFSNYGFNSVDIAAPGENIYASSLRRITAYYQDFDLNSISGWTVGSEIGNLSNYSWTISDNMLTDGSGTSQNYSANTNTWAKSPPISLLLNGNSLTGPELEINILYDIESPSAFSNYQYDYFVIEASTNGIIWQQLPLSKLSGSSNGLFITMKYSLSEFEFYPSIILRFRLKTDSIYNHGGLKISDIKITGADPFPEDGNAYTFTQGTSFSAPIVTGICAMIMGIGPELSPFQIKELLINNAIPLDSLSSKVSSGGMVNAYNSISSIYNPINMKVMLSSDMITWNEYGEIEAFDNYNFTDYGVSITNIDTSLSEDYCFFDLEIKGKDFNGNTFQIFDFYRFDLSGTSFNLTFKDISKKWFFKLEYD